MIIKAYKFTCDSCGYSEYYDAENRSEAKQEARADGWKMHSKRSCACSVDCYLRLVAK